MNTITIPRQLTKGDDLVILSRARYEKLTRFSQRSRIIPQGDDLHVALREVLKGKIRGPFRSVKTLQRSLER